MLEGGQTRGCVVAKSEMGWLAEGRDRRGGEEQGIWRDTWIMPTSWRGSGNEI